MTPYSAELIVEADLHGIRIDSFLIRHFRNYTAWRMQRMVRAGQITIDHAPVDSSRRVFTGETVQVRLVEPPDKLLDSQPVPWRLVYEDRWLLVVDKPAGVIAHPTGDFQSGTLANGLQAYLDECGPLRGLIRPGIVHRLDRQTSGLMVIATHYRSHAALSTAFETGRVCKTYLAIVEGLIDDNEGVIDAPIGRARSGSRVLMSARGDAVGASPARTSYRVIERLRVHTLVAAKPHTGRNHQIRVHMAHLGHPVLGDEFYDKGGQFKLPPSVFESRTSECLIPGRHALHAVSLGFAHPVTSVWLEFHAPLPRALRETCQHLHPPHSVGQMSPSLLGRQT